jgi:hypothetical protein
MKTFLLGLAVVAATLLGGTTAQAGFLNGAILFRANEALGADFAGNLQNRTYISQTKEFGSGSFASLPNFSTTWAGFSVDATSGGGIASISNASFGNFTKTAVLADTTVGMTRTITLFGNFDGGTSLSTFDVTPSYLTVKIDQIATGIPAPNNFRFATSVTLQAVPEPTSIALFGLGALGLVARRFRRK